MGSFLASIEHKGPISSKSNDLFFDKNLQHIYEYHGIFKSICDDFGINKSSFMEIFGTDEQFSSWESEKTGKVDALEIFSALIIMAEQCTFKQKLKFLFNIYDFNDIRSISPTDLEYLLVEMCNSVYKLYKMNSRVNHYQIADLVSNYFDLSKRINITNLFNFCVSVVQIKTFMKFIGLGNNQIQQLQVVKDHKIQGKFSQLLNIQQDQHKKYNSQQQILRYSDLIKKMVPREVKKDKLVNCKQSWIYGIKTDNIQRPFVLVEDWLIYVVSNMVVVYSCSLNQQKIYTSHNCQVISLVYDNQKQIVITSEKKHNPGIYFWKPFTLQTVYVLHTQHQNGIYLMNLIDYNNKLVTAGLRPNTSIIIYSTNTYEQLQSFYLPLMLIQIVSPLNFVEQFQGDSYIHDSFIACSSSSFYYFDCTSQQVNITQFEIQKRRTITAICSVYANIENTYLSTYIRQTSSNFISIIGYLSGQLSLVYLKNSKQNIKDIYTLKNQVSNIKITQQVLIVSSLNELWLFKLSTLSHEVVPFKVIKIDDIGNFNLLSTKIQYFDTQIGNMIVMTDQGQVIKIQVPIWEISQETTNKNWKVQKLCNFLKLQQKTTALCVLEQKIAYLSSHNNRVISIDLKTHEIVDVWSISGVITAMDVISFQQGIIITAIGKLPGNMLLRIGSEEDPRKFQCGSQIIDIKLASDYSYLSLCTKDSHVFVFSNTTNNLLSQAPKKLKFQNQRPLSISFSDDNKSFFVCTNLRNVYQFYLPDLKNKNVFKDNDRIYISHWGLKYCYNSYNQYQQNLPALLGASQKPYLLTTPQGQIRYYQNLKDLIINSYKKIRNHLGPISMMTMCPQAHKFYSLGSIDNCLIQWKVSQVAEIQTKTQINNNMNFTIKNSIQSPLIKYSNSKQKNVKKDTFSLFKGTTRNVISQYFSQNIVPQPNDIYYSNLILKPQYIYGICSKKSKNCYFNLSKPNSVIYFTSRFICSLDHTTQQQKIITCTKMKISCITINNEGVIAAGQDAQNPFIFIINQGKLETTHKQKIIHMSFYKNDLYSFGSNGNVFSINIHDYKLGTLLEQRIIEQHIQSFLVIKENQFYTFPQIKLWTNVSPSQSLGQATSACILIKSNDVCCSNIERDICIIRNKRIIKVKENAHKKQITILKQMDTSQGIVISGGRDQVVKVWGHNFEQLCTIELRSCKALTRLYTNSTTNSVQLSQLIINNIDTQNDQILVSLKNGRVLLFTSIFQNIVSSNVLLQHSSQKQHDYEHQVYIDLHPKLPLMASIGDDNYLVIKHYIVKNTLIRQYFTTKPKAVKFSPNSKLLVVGFQNGQFLIYMILINNDTIVLNQIQKFQDQKSSIFTIQFSDCCSYIAVSYLPSNSNDQQAQGSKVLLYKSKDSESFDNHYFKAIEIGQQSLQGHNSSNKLPNCACFLHFFKDKGRTSLLIYYQKVNQYHLRIGKDPNGQFKLFDIEKKTITKQDEINIDWNQVKFPSYVNCSHIENQQQLLMTSMIIYKQNVIYGSTDGDIYIVKKNSLSGKFEDINKLKDMSMARTYPCLTSFISQLEISPDGRYLFCTSVIDQTIIQYQLCQQAISAHVCNIQNQSQQQVISKQQFFNYLNNFVPLRDEINQILNDIEGQINPLPVQLQKTKVLGRRAYDRKNNLIYDGMGNLLYHVGTSIVIQNIANKNQKYIPSNSNFNSASYQISCIAFNKRKNLLAIATEQYQSNIFIWNIHAKICISQFSIDCSLITQMCFSNDGQMLIISGLFRKYYTVCILVQLKSCKVLSNSSFVHDNYWFLKSLSFKYQNNYQFVTCGVEHLSLWTYEADTLTFQSFDIEHINTTFTSILDTEQFTIICCENGSIYLWDNLLLIYNFKVHQSSIQTISLISKNQIITGSISGQIVMSRIQRQQYQILHTWRLEDLLKIQKPMPFQNDSYNIKYTIQSLTTDNNTVYIGTRCGSIYSINVHSNQFETVNICHDNQKPISCCFDDQDKRFFYISNFGYLEIWDIESQNIVFAYQFEKRVKKILSLNGLSLIVFEKSIQLFDFESSIPNFKQDYRIQFQGFVIVDCILNSLKTNLIIAITDKEKTDIIMYKLDGRIQQMKSMTLNIQLQYLDISLDDHFLLFKDKFEDIGIIQINQFRRMNTIFIQFSLQWRSRGIKLNQDALNIHSCYNKQNFITRVVYLSDNHLLVGDELGTLRIFEYPTQSKKLGQLHSACYTDHLNLINGLEISTNRKWILSMSQTDRSLILWKVVNK